MIFTLYNNQTEQETAIYSIRNKNGYPMFLIYERGQWLWKSAKHFKPQGSCAGGFTVTDANGQVVAIYEKKGEHIETDNN